MEAHTRVDFTNRLQYSCVDDFTGVTRRKNIACNVHAMEGSPD